MKTTISRTKKAAIAIPAALICAMASTANAGEWSANASMTSNYIWRGLTQTENEAAVQGGIDYAADNGFYIGTWASNVHGLEKIQSDAALYKEIAIPFSRDRRPYHFD